MPPRRAVKRAVIESSDDEDASPTNSPPAAKRQAHSRRTVVRADDEDAQPTVARDVPTPTAQLSGAEEDDAAPPAPTTPPAAAALEVPRIAVERSSPVRPPAEAMQRRGSDAENAPEAGPSTPRQAAPIPRSASRPPPSASSMRQPSLAPNGRARSVSVAPPPEPEKPAGPVERLVIHKLVLRDFKSYAGTQEIGPFHKVVERELTPRQSFSAIVGPNGSGKSNTIDALLFVFGFKANKMRQGHVSELIHVSEGKEPTSCSVEIHFRDIVDLPGPDAYDIVPDSTLIVSRTAYKNNSSTYKINNRTATMKDVTTLLKGRGIDLDHKRFLILQGEVESIAQMKPKAPNEHEDGLLEYLEDIIGTTRLVAPIGEAGKALEALVEERSEKFARLKIVEREKLALEPRKAEADAWIRDTNDAVLRNSELWQLNRHNHNRTLVNAQAEAAAAQAQLAQETQEQAETRAQVAEAQTAVKETMAEVKNIELAASKVIKILTDFETKEATLQEREKQASVKHKKLGESIRTDKHSLSTAEAELRNSTVAADKYRNELRSLERDLEKHEAELEQITDSLKGKTDHLQVQVEQHQRDLQPWQAKIDDKRAALDVAVSERELLEQKAASAQRALDQAQEALQRARSDAEGRSSEIAALTDERAQADRNVAAAQAKVQAAAAQDATLRAQSMAARAKHEEARANQSARTSKGKVLQELTRLRDQGRLDGFIGRLGSLGRIDDKYDVAVSTACGALDNLLCDRVTTGQACLDHLRRTKAGRATIMCLDQLKVNEQDLALRQYPEGVPRLFDLVTPKEPHYAAAFYQAMRDTLVATDLAQANRIAFGGQRRYRVVTLDGQLIDTSGTMSGGGTRVARGIMSSKIQSDVDSSPEAVARFERARIDADEALQGALREREAAETELKALRRRIPELENQLERAQLGARQDGKRVADAERRVAELRAQSKPDSADVRQIADLGRTIDTLTTELEALTASASEIEAEIKVLKKKILDLGGLPLKMAMSRVNDTKAAIETTTADVTKHELNKSKAEKAIAKSTKALETNGAAQVELADELATIAKELRQLRTESVSLREKVDEFRSVLEDRKAALAEDQALVDKMKAKMNQFAAKTVTLQRSLEAAEALQRRAAKSVEEAERKLETLVLIETYEDDDDEDAIEVDPDVKPELDEDGQPIAPVRKPKQPVELRQYTAEELDEFDADELKHEIAIIEDRQSKKNVDLGVIEEYRKRQRDYEERVADLAATTAKRDEAKSALEALRKQRLDEFMTGFHAISMKLKEMYQMITLGGNAELELGDSLDPFSEGINFSVMPPKKSWKNIGNLSGGEKTLSSLALVFALHVYKPTPLYFMDEIDAALDFRNVSIIAHYIKDRCKAGQFIIISLRNNMFELASRLVGIYKTSNTTKTIAIDNNDLHKMAASAITPANLVLAESGV